MPSCHQTATRETGNSTRFQELTLTETSHACQVVSEMDKSSCVGSDATEFDTKPVAVPATSLIEEVFESSNSVPFPTTAWACHRVNVKGLRTVMKFS
uniref:Uncharacterized protein n=1 Tax=Rhipicephalus zambeziensis TaxID=60191 RepID=A0A224YEQ9_9ACAR